MTEKHTTDVVIIGSGIAALVAAKRLSEHKNVIVITKSKKEVSNSNMAQGGVAAAFSRKDHWKNHFIDTMTAGNHHNLENAVELLVKKGPQYLHEMIDEGMNFDSDDNGKLLLGQEGAHGQRRILHAGGDATGRALVQFMLDQLEGKVTILEDVMAVDLLVDANTCYGVKARTNTGETKKIVCKDTIIATGGCGGLYSYTSNDPTITGDGIAMAYRAGADVVDMEFVQFHPTMLYVNGQVKGLISEAVRGEGAVLVTASGKQLMGDVHPQQDLAPRDIVARTIHQAVLNGEEVYLDISKIKNFRHRFPTITQICEEHGVNVEAGKLPVVPGAHFLMGGIQTNESGQTSVKHLHAIGEAAWTGVHGANRLASNSLLEGIVFANALADYLVMQPMEPYSRARPITALAAPTYEFKSLPSIHEIKQMMMTFVGIVRNEEGLLVTKKWFEQYLPSMSLLVPDSLTNEEVIIYNMLQTGWLITTSALQRTESRGGHYRSDYPTEMIEWEKQRLVRNTYVTVLNANA